jgi:hypothetical protein
MFKPSRRLRVILLIAGIGLIPGIIVIRGLFAPVVALDVLKLPDYSVSELIDGLRTESVEGLGTHSTAWADGFAAIDEEPEFRGGILGSSKPVISPVMKELVGRGAAALPELMSHLSDRRTTQLEIKLPFGSFGAMWHSDEYEPRYAEPEKQPPNVNSERGFGERHIPERAYKVRVGDLCYVAIGQIVNRRMNVTRYQPSGCVVINSPIETPTLAEAVKQDWGGLSAVEHKKSLMHDALDPEERAVQPALKRFQFYYPDAAKVFIANLPGVNKKD